MANPANRTLSPSADYRAIIVLKPSDTVISLLIDRTTSSNITFGTCVANLYYMRMGKGSISQGNDYEHKIVFHKDDSNNLTLIGTIDLSNTIQ